VVSGRTSVLDLDENELIAGLRSGDERALEALYRLHAGRVYGLGLCAQDWMSHSRNLENRHHAII